MARYSILTKEERDAFERVPKINSTEKFRIFNRLIVDTKINGILKRYPSLSKAHIYTILINYMYSGRIYQHVCHSESFRYVCRYFKISSEDRAQEYLSGTFNKHKQLIMDILGIEVFTLRQKCELETYVQSILNNKLDLKEIFLLAVVYLIDKKVAVPNSTTLEKIVLDIANSNEDILKKRIADITKANISILNTLLEIGSESKYIITELKKLSHSVKMKSIKENVLILDSINKYLEAAHSVCDTLNLSKEIIENYAKIIMKERISEFIKREKASQYPYLASFIVYHHKKVNDHLIESAFMLIRNLKSSVKKDLSENYLELKNVRHQKAEKLMGQVDEHKNILDKVRGILKEKASDEDKLKRIKKFISVLTASVNQNQDMVINILNSFDNHDKEFYGLITIKAKSIIHKIERFIFKIEFEFLFLSTSKQIALYHYIKVKGDRKQLKQTSFLSHKQMKYVVSVDGSIKDYYLYKFLLIDLLLKEITAGKITVKCSNTYTDLESFLIPSKEWNSNRNKYLKKANLLHFKNPEKLISNICLENTSLFDDLNLRLEDDDEEMLRVNQNKQIIVKTPRMNSNNDKNILKNYLPDTQIVPLVEVLSVVNRFTTFTSEMKHLKGRFARKSIHEKEFLGAIVGIGCHVGINKFEKISKNVNRNNLRHAAIWYLSKENVIAANNKIINFMDKLNLGKIYYINNALFTSSDGQKWPVSKNSIVAKRSFKYFGTGKGVVVNTHVDSRNIVFHSKVISSTEREASTVLDGLLYNNNINSDVHTTDTHGFTEVMFAMIELSGITFAPRIKRLKEQILYGTGEDLKQFKSSAIKVNKKINSNKIIKNWDTILRIIVSIKLGYTSSSKISKRLTSYSWENPIYQGLKEVGRLYKTRFILKYFNDVELRKNIERQLNKVETSNRFSKALSFGNNHELDCSTFEEMEVVEGCKRLIKNSIILWNYLYFTNLINKEKSYERKVELLKIIKNSSMVRWSHINLLGEYDFSQSTLRDSQGFDGKNNIDNKLLNKVIDSKILL